MDLDACERLLPNNTGISDVDHLKVVIDDSQVVAIPCRCTHGLLGTSHRYTLRCVGWRAMACPGDQVESKEALTLSQYPGDPEGYANPFENLTWRNPSE